MKLKKEEKILIGVGIGVLVITIIIIVIKKIRDRRALNTESNNNNIFYSNTNTGTGTNTGINTGTSTVTSISFPLQKGSGFNGRPSEENKAVQRLQNYLNSRKRVYNLTAVTKVTLTDLETDGKFGDKTLNMLKALHNVNSVSKQFYDTKVYIS